MLWFVKHGSLAFSNQCGNKVANPGDFAITRSMSPFFIECRTDEEAVHEVLHVQAAARKVLDDARAAAGAAATARADEVTGARLPTLALSTLQETTQGGLRLAPFEEYGITTVGQLLGYAEHQLDAIPGVGQATARQALSLIHI